MPNKRISYFGPPGSFTHAAALTKFNKNRYDFISGDTFEQTFGLVYSGQAEYGVLPVENSTEGIVALTYHLLVGQGRQPEVTICGEIFHRINLHLAALPGVNTENIKSIYTKGIARGQCAKWLRDNLPAASFEAENSTSAAAAAVASSTNRTKGAIVGSLASELYGLNILAHSIQDLKDNSTRFFILGKRRLHKKNLPKKCSVALVLMDRVAAITDAFGIIARRNLNVRSVKVAPVLAPQLTTWKDWFFIDISLPRKLKEAELLIDELKLDLARNNHLVLEARFIGLYCDSEPHAMVEERYLRAKRWGETPGFLSEEPSTTLDAIMTQQGRESSEIECKSTLRWNLKESRKDRTMEIVVLKTIAGFMNCEGGCLFIGVSDNGEICGLDTDYATLQKPNQDGFELHLRNIVKSALGTDIAGVIEVRFLQGNQKMCAVF